MLFKTHIKKNEIGLLYRQGDFLRVLEPGTWRLPGIWLGYQQLEIVNILETRFRNPILDLLVREPELRSRLEVLDLAEDERAVIWRDGRVFDLVGAGLFAYWRQPYSIKVEKFSVADLRFTSPQLDAILQLPAAKSLLAAVDVESYERLLVRRGGEIVAVLGAGRHAFWNRAASITWKAIDLREQIADVQGQEIMTADKVTLRLNLVVGYRVTDPVLAATVVENAAAAVYRQAQLGLRAAVGGRDLDRLLADKDGIANEVRQALASPAAAFGVAIESVGIRDVILPGDMKTILNQVIEAQKQAEANLIRRREETAAARSQANTAKLLAENPILLRLKELEALESILAGTKATFVLGQGDLGQQIRGLVAARDGE